MREKSRRLTSLESVDYFKAESQRVQKLTQSRNCDINPPVSCVRDRRILQLTIAVLAAMTANSDRALTFIAAEKSFC
jgi:hypothetical protein